MGPQKSAALEQIFDEIPLGLAWLSPDGGVAAANPPAQLLLEGPWASTVLHTVIQLCDRASQGSPIVQAMLPLGTMGELQLILSSGTDGRLLYLRRTVVPRLNAEITVLRTLIHALVESLPPHEAIERAMGALAGALPGSQLSLFQLAGPEPRLVRLYPREVGTAGPDGRSPRRLDPDDSAAARAFLSGQPVHVSNLARSPFESDRHIAQGEGLSTIDIPVDARGERVAVIEVCGATGSLGAGEIRLVEGLADVVGALLDRARKETAARVEKEARRAALNSLEDAYVELDPRGRLVLAAGRVRDIFGLEPAELMGRQIDDWLAPEEAQRFHSLVDAAIRLGQASGELTLVSVDGATALCVASVGAAWSPSGVLVRAVVRNVSLPHTIDREVDQARSSAVHQDRLARIGRLATGVAHEINNPLGFMTLNLTEVVRAMERQIQGDPEGPPWSPDELLEMLKDVSRGAERIREIVGRLDGAALFPMAGPDESLSFDPLQAVRDAVDQFRGETVGREILIESGPLPPIQGSAAAFTRIMLNLLSNGRDAMGESGVLRVRAGTNGRLVSFEIIDEGPGISPELQAHVFEPFFTTQEVGQGTGLGLYAARQLATRLHGRLEFTTGQHGSTFTLTLPRADGRPDAPPESFLGRTLAT